MKPADQKIIQIIPTAAPLFAVYEQEGFNRTDLILERCDVVALVDTSQGQDVIGLVLEDWGYHFPSTTINFVGYATSIENAKQRYFKANEKGDIEIV